MNQLRNNTSDFDNQEVIDELLDAREGDKIQATVPKSEGGLGLSMADLSEVIASETGDDLNYVLTSGVRNNDGLQHYRFIIRTDTQTRYVLGSFGHNDQPTDIGFVVKQAGDSIDFEYAGIFDRSKLDHRYDDEDIDKLEQKTIEGLKDSEIAVPEVLEDRVSVNYLGDSTVGFRVTEPANWHKMYTGDVVDELAEKYDMDASDIYTDILRAIIQYRDKEKVELIYNIDIKNISDKNR